MKEELINIIKQILKEAKKENIPLGRTRLIKILYLLEIEYYKYNRRRLTNLTWQYYHYGPYPKEIEQILNTKEFETEEMDLEDDRTFKPINLFYNEVDKDYVDFKVKSLIPELIKTWGDEDLNSLLNYVYFETPPMENAKKGDILDFSTVPAWEEMTIKQVKIDKKKIYPIRRNIKKILAEKKAKVIEFSIDSELIEGLRIWDEGLFNIKFPKKVKISLETGKKR